MRIVLLRSLIVFPNICTLLTGAFLGAPPLSRARGGGPFEYIMRGMSVAVMSHIVFLLAIAIAFGAGMVVVMLLVMLFEGLPALAIGAISGGVLYLVRGSKLRNP